MHHSILPFKLSQEEKMDSIFHPGDGLSTRTEPASPCPMITARFPLLPVEDLPTLLKTHQAFGNKSGKLIKSMSALSVAVGYFFFH